MYEQIDEHTEQAQGREIWQYKNKANWDALTVIEADRTQLIEDVLYQILTERNLEDMVGVQIDKFAEYVNLERGNLNDTDFKARIRLEINTLHSAGQVDILLSNLESLSGLEVADMRLLQIFPLTLFIYMLVDAYDDLTPEQLLTINIVMQNIRIAGCSLQIGLQLKSSAFILSDNPAGGPAGTGFATLPDGSDGGNFTRNINQI
jgi:hypothetical protein